MSLLALSLSSLSFSAPWALLVLAGAPLLYLLLRVTPPPPQRIAFPPLKLILDLKKPDATPARTPLWLLILRMALAALAVLAMAGPVLTPSGAPAAKNGPLLLLIDDGWPAARDWTLRVQAAESRLEAAGREGQPAAVLAFSEPPAEALAAQDASAALARLRAIKPKAFLPARAAAFDAIAAFMKAHPDAQVVWLTDALEDADGAGFAAQLAALAPETEILRDPRPVQVIASADNGVAAMETRLVRSARGGAAAGRVRASDAKGASLGEADFDFGQDLTAKALFDLPVQLRNEIARLEILGETSAGAVLLLDSGSRRRRVGMVAGATGEQPLLSPLHFLRDALAALRRPARGQARRRRSGRPGARRRRGRADPRRRQRRRAGLAGAARRLPRRGRDAGAFRRPAPRRRRRRPVPDQTAARRPHAWRRPVVGQAQAAGALRGNQSLFRPDAARRGHGVAAGAGRAGRGPARRRPGRGSPMARPSSRRTGAGREPWSCSMSRRIPAGRTCRCRACSSRC